MFDLDGLRRAVDAHGTVARVVVAEVKGSTPREVGAAMLVWREGQSGTIGGGTLEFQAAEAARAGRTGLHRQALGPDLGQCCGGAVTLLTERFAAADLAQLDGDVVARPARGGAFSYDEKGTELLNNSDPPLAVQRVLRAARGQGVCPASVLVDGWMIEPVLQATRPLWIWGAGHVGRAIVDVLAPLPDIAITWVDTGPDRFPTDVPKGVTVLPAATPALLARHAPINAEHLILTYSHDLDLDLCHQLLMHGFTSAGLIGSATKWARFRSRLTGLGHGPAEIDRIRCPIGQPGLGKHPQSIAIGVAAELLAAAKPVQTQRTDAESAPQIKEIPA